MARTPSSTSSHPAPAQRLAIGGVDPLGGEALGQLGHVGALVSVLGQLGGGHPGGDRVGETLHLATRVVDVELAPHVVPDSLQQSHQGVPVGGVAAAADVQRPGRVGGDELDQDALGRVGRGRAEPLAGGAQAGHRAPVPSVGKEEVDEPRPCHLDPLDAAGGAELAPQLDPEALGDGARGLTERGGEQHRRIGAVVAELRLGRAVEGGLRLGRLAVAQREGRLANGKVKLGDRVFGCHRSHRMSLAAAPAARWTRVRWPTCAQP